MKTSIQLTLCLTVAIATLPLHAKVLSYIENSPNGHWSDPGNWITPDFENGVPEDGDTLYFLNALFAVNGLVVSINDLTNLTVSSLVFGHDDVEYEIYIIQGNPLRVSNSIEVNAPETTALIQCDLTVVNGALFRAAADRGLNNPAVLNVMGALVMEGTGDLTLQTHYAGKIELAGPISGNGNLRLPSYTPVEGNGALLVKLSGTQGNSFAGAIIMASGRTLELDKQSGVAVPGPLFIGTNCEVSLKRPHQIADTAKVAITAGGRLRLDGNAESVASLCLTNGSTDAFAALVSTDGAVLSVLENITSANDSATVTPFVRGKLGLTPGSHTIHTTGSQTFALHIEALIVGDGGFTKTGASGLILEGNSSFNGDAVLQEGRVDVNHANALGSPSGATILYGGELYVNGVAIGLETLFVDRVTARIPELGAILNALDVSSWAGPVELNTNLTVSGGTMTFSGAITGPGGLRLIFNDRVQLTGAAANTYTGDTLSGATLLELNKPSGVYAFGGRLFVWDGNTAPKEVRWLQDYQCVGADVTLFFSGLINLNNHREDFGPVTFTGGAISTGAGELGIYGLVTVNPSSDAALISGRLGLPPGLREFRVGDGVAFPDLRIDAHVLGAGHLRKTGLGQMWLTASNSYQGLTTVAEGALSVLNPYGLGASGTGTTVNDGATLELNFAGGIMPDRWRCGARASQETERWARSATSRCAIRFPRFSPPSISPPTPRSPSPLAAG